MYFKAMNHNIDHITVGRISRADNGDFTFVGKNISSSVSDVNGVITTSNNVAPAGIPSLRISNGEQTLQDGDILLMYPSGGVRLLYRSAWFSNAIFLTNQCNNNCICCPQPPKEDLEDLFGIALQMVQLIPDESPTIGITGGEPTNVWNNLVNIVGFTKAVLPKSFLHLLTNARAFADYDKAAQLASVSQGDLLICTPIYSDVHHLHDEITGISGSFWEAVAGLKNLARASVPMEIRVLISKQNYTRLPQIAHFIYRNLPFVSHVALMGIELVGYAAKHKKNLWVSPAVYMPYLEKTILMLKQRDMHASIYNHPLCVVPDNLKRVLRNSVSEWKVSYPKVCADCIAKEDCPGFFSSVTKEIEPELKPFRISNAS